MSATFFGDPSQSWSDALGERRAPPRSSTTASDGLRLRTPARVRRLQQDVPERVPRRGGLDRHAREHLGLQQPDRPRQPAQPDRAHLRAAHRRRGSARRCSAAWSWDGRSPTTFATPASSTTRHHGHCAGRRLPTISRAGHLPPERDRRRQPHRARTRAGVYGRTRWRWPVSCQPIAGRPARAVRPRLPQQQHRRRPEPHRRPGLAPRGRWWSSRSSRSRSTAATACRTCPARAISSPRSRRPPRRSSRRSSRTTRSAPSGTCASGCRTHRGGVPARPHQHHRSRPARSRRAPCRPGASAPAGSSLGARAT